eukprot:m.73779 g.73779  ORF g.73779 m.73779 type:complete len:337 (+) comp14479_c1_seq1:181-1191(+)
MAGLDMRRQSDFITMLLELGKPGKDTPMTHDPVLLCTETIRTIQMVSDSLLLRERDHPLSQQPFSGCCDTIVAKTKVVSTTVERLQDSVKSALDPKKICVLLGELAESIAILTEASVQAVFMLAEGNSKCGKPIRGAIDNYPLARARLAIQLATDGFQRPSLTPEQVMAISAVVATHLEALRAQCNSAGERTKNEQFKAAARGLSGVASLLVAAVKEYVGSPSQAARLQCATFSRPLVETVEALLSYVHSNDSFLGTPPYIPQDVEQYVKPLQAAARVTCSASCLFVGSMKNVLTSPKDTASRSNLTKLAGTLEDALAELVAAVKAIQRANLVRER